LIAKCTGGGKKCAGGGKKCTGGGKKCTGGGKKFNRSFDHRKLKGTDHVGDLDFGMRIILKSTLKEHGLRVWIEFVYLRVGPRGGLFRL
jgi:hypothetical protein